MKSWWFLIALVVLVWTVCCQADKSFCARDPHHPSCTGTVNSQPREEKGGAPAAKIPSFCARDPHHPACARFQQQKKRPPGERDVLSHTHTQRTPPLASTSFFPDPDSDTATPASSWLKRGLLLSLLALPVAVAALVHVWSAHRQRARLTYTRNQALRLLQQANALKPSEHELRAPLLMRLQTLMRLRAEEGRELGTYTIDAYASSASCTAEGRGVLGFAKELCVLLGSLDAMVDSAEELYCGMYGRESKHRKRVQRGHYSGVNSVAFSPDGKTVVSGSTDKTIRLWSVETGETIQKLKGHSRLVNSVAFSPDGKTVVSGSADKTIRLWSVETGETIHQLQGHSDYVLSVAFSPDGKTVVSGSFDYNIRLWSVETGETIQELKGHSFRVYSVAFSPDGKTVVSSSMDETIRLWSVETGETIQELKGHSHHVNSVAFRPDEKTVVSGSTDKTIRLLSVETGETIQELKGHSSSVFSVAFSPDGKTVVSGSEDETIRLWSVETGETIQELKGHYNGVESVAFSPDGKSVVSGSGDNTIRLWSVEIGETIKVLKDHPGGKDVLAMTGKALGTRLETLVGLMEYCARVDALPGTNGYEDMLAGVFGGLVSMVRGLELDLKVCVCLNVSVCKCV
jgi:WD40 repeat protein